jgi:hypothetical protein
MRLYKAVTKDQCAKIISEKLIDGWFPTKAEAWAALAGSIKEVPADAPKPKRGRPAKPKE